VFLGPGFDGVRLRIGILGEKIIFFDKPVDLEPMVQAVFLTGIIGKRVWPLLRVEDRIEDCWHNRLRIASQVE
jgi:hypothetical protein